MAIESSSDELELRRIVEILLARSRLVVTFALLGALAAIGITLAATIIYQSTSVVYFEIGKNSTVQLAKPLKELAESSHLIDQVKEGVGYSVPPMPDRFTAKVIDNLLFLRTLDESESHAGQLAAKWASLVADTATAQNKFVVERARAAILQTVTACQNELEAKQSKLREFIAKGSFGKVEDDPLFDTLHTLNADLAEKNAQVSALHSEQNVLIKVDNANDAVELPRARKDPVLRACLRRIEEFQADLAVSRDEPQPNPGDTKKIEDKIASLKAKVLNLVKAYSTQIRFELDQVTSEQVIISNSIGQARQEIKGIEDRHQQFIELEAAVSAAQMRCADASKAKNEFEINNASYGAHIWEDGTKNAEIFRKHEFLRNTAIGVVAGVFLSLIVIAILEIARNPSQEGHPR